MEKYFRIGRAWELLDNKNVTRDKTPIIIKKIGHIYLRRIEASLGDINLLIAGATIDDWNKIIPIINPDII